MVSDSPGWVSESTSIVTAAHAAGVQLVRFEYCDVSGVTRAKSVHVSQLASKLVEGVGLTRAQMAIDLLEHVVPVAGMEPVGEIRLVPDPATWTVLPWVPATASVLCDQLDHDRRDWGACPRAFLKRAIAAAAELGISLRASFENEYYVARMQDGRYIPDDAPFHAPVYSPIGLDHHAQLLIDTVDALEAQGLEVESALNEYGPGQLEIAVRHTDALGAADNQMKFRDTARGVASRHGLVASFAPKPYPDRIGSGAHIHFSLWSDAGQNLLYDPRSEGGLSGEGRAFIAGVAAHLPALVALTAPSYNSFRRLQPGAWASATTAWGFDNREAALRVASPFFGREAQTYNIEFKASDPSANPYLALGSLLLCGLDGIRHGLEPAMPADRDPAGLTPAELAAAGIRPLPTSMAEALDLLQGDELLTGALGDLLGRCYLAVRRSEERAFAAADLDFELHHHFYRF